MHIHFPVINFACLHFGLESDCNVVLLIMHIILYQEIEDRCKRDLGLRASENTLIPHLFKNDLH